MSAASSVTIAINFLKQLYCEYMIIIFVLEVRLTTEWNLFSFLILKNLKSTMDGWALFRRALPQLWMLLLWLSWTRSVWWYETFLSNFTNFVFLKRCIFLFGLQVFNWRVVDCDLAIGLCTLLSRAEVFKILWKVIDNTWQNYDKILVGDRKMS